MLVRKGRPRGGCGGCVYSFRCCSVGGGKSGEDVDWGSYEEPAKGGERGRYGHELGPVVQLSLPVCSGL